MRNRIAASLVLMLLMAACGGNSPFSAVTSTSVAATTTAAETTTVETTTTTLAPLVAGPVADWDGQQVGSVCLQVTQSYPQVPAYEYDLVSLLGELLTPVGVAVLTPGDTCDAVLEVQMSLEGRPAEYTGIGTIYSGVLRTFDMTLSTEGHDPLDYHHLTDTPPGELAASDEPKTPEAFLERWADVWATVALEGLVQFWGPAVAIEALQSETYKVDAYSHLCELGGFAAGECLPTDYQTWRTWFDQGAGGDAAAGTTDPLPTADQPGPVTCDGCPQIVGVTDFAPDVDAATTLTLTGTVAGASGLGTFFVDDGSGRSVGGPIPLEDDGSFQVTVPLFCGEQTVKLAWQNSAGSSGVVVRPTGTTCSPAALLVTLTWDNLGDDFELHLIREGGRINDRTGDGSISNDCTWNTCISRSPDWGALGSPADNPVKDIDDTGSYGPENIRLQQPESMTYTVMVEHWGSGSPNADGKVTISVEGGQVLTVPIKDLAPHWVVTVATVEFPSGEITPIGKQYDCNAEWGFNGGCGAALP